MAWQEDRHERTEAASPRRRHEAREKGQVAKSREIASVAVLMAGLIVFYFFGREMFQSLEGVMRRFIVESGSFDLSQEGLYKLYKATLINIAYLLLPLVFFPLVGIAASMAQVGLLFTAEPLMPNLSRINPLEGFKRLISPAALVEMIKGILKLAIISYAAYLGIKDEMSNFTGLADMEIRRIASYIGYSSLRIFVKTSWVLIILAILDYVFQRREMEKSIRMTKHEVKEEFKETEGQPLIKSKIKSLQRQMAKGRMMDDVPKATVVITNPTHLAVAVRYEQGKMRAPVVVAKGAGLIAERIKEIARSHKIPMVENKSLAQAIWKGVEIGKEIPVSLYKAIAEVLAYAYRLKAKK